ncbi:COP9 signalosome complex subunit 8 [Scaptodrosophila lebanonensis]|uniref:COP9 signalosome complex subunit 8 n=1 Tax=Drosophila lebanonensis TaxID=7225 RepID=A0A6J2TJ14_DROLE|nr:COP9 signalosome complex subunit 8 [Scaptodrosophila lebanonensis]
MQVYKYQELMEKLENDELEQIGLGPEVYAQLLAIYLYQSELSKAKLLWMRMSDNLKNKEENKELTQLHLLTVALQKNDSSDFFDYIKFEWSENVKPIVEDLLAKQREELFTLMGTAYASIYEQNLLEMTQMSAEELKSACAALNWTQEQDGDQVIILPIPKETVSSVAGDDQLLKLTEFVSFLEN